MSGHCVHDKYFSHEFCCRQVKAFFMLQGTTALMLLTASAFHRQSVLKKHTNSKIMLDPGIMQGAGAPIVGIPGWGCPAFQWVPMGAGLVLQASTG